MVCVLTGRMPSNLCLLVSTFQRHLTTQLLLHSISKGLPIERHHGGMLGAKPQVVGIVSGLRALLLCSWLCHLRRNLRMNDSLPSCFTWCFQGFVFEHLSPRPDFVLCFSFAHKHVHQASLHTLRLASNRRLRVLALAVVWPLDFFSLSSFCFNLAWCFLLFFVHLLCFPLLLLSLFILFLFFAFLTSLSFCFVLRISASVSAYLSRLHHFLWLFAQGFPFAFVAPWSACCKAQQPWPWLLRRIRRLFLRSSLFLSEASSQRADNRQRTEAQLHHTFTTRTKPASICARTKKVCRHKKFAARPEWLAILSASATMNFLSFPRCFFSAPAVLTVGASTPCQECKNAPNQPSTDYYRQIRMNKTVATRNIFS